MPGIREPLKRWECIRSGDVRYMKAFIGKEFISFMIILPNLTIFSAKSLWGLAGCLRFHEI
jgi:hypothetical protein